MIFFQKGSPSARMCRKDLQAGLYEALDNFRDRKRVLAIPPDYTRFHSQAGILTEFVWEYFGDHLTDVLPATGTHFPVSDSEKDAMFGRVPKSLFRIHDWKNGSVTLGEIPADFVRKISEGVVDYPIPVQVDKLVASGTHDLIISLGQVVPHEVIGVAGYNKNVFIGTGGPEAINKTHFLGAAYGMERMMGKVKTPVREVLNYGARCFGSRLPILYVLTVVAAERDGSPAVRGLFVGDDEECFQRAAALSLQVNVELLEKPLKKIVVYLDPAEYKSTWLGNKSIYRTRMAIADGGELIVLAPGLAQFGEDRNIDALIRKYGYVGTSRVLALMKVHTDLQQNLGTAAHLIHGSSEGRFSVTYCPGNISRPDMESVHFRYAELDEMIRTYDPKKLHDGVNRLSDGEEIYYISNPALGLWASREFFQSQ
ncbi:MAG TPA: lactate racemase domain-containing protein [Bacteroidota bacterium]|nr:lactate racemase domain-containing protein [Bacteroidota bacterium]